MDNKENPAPPEVLVERERDDLREEGAKCEGSYIPYGYLGEIEMNFLFTKIAIGLSFISFVLSMITFLGI